MRVLLVEDDAKIASLIIKGLKQESFAVDYAADGAKGLKFALMEGYDVAVIDRMLPKLDGLSLIQEVRRRRISTPVIILSAKHTVDDRVRGLQTGSDDYLTKPFAFSELLARIRALIRRAGATEATVTLCLGELSMNLLTREVTRAEEEIVLQPREFALLEYLMRNKGHVVSKTMIMQNLWDCSFDPQTNLVDVLVCRLRNKVDKNYEKKMVHTVRGIGYVLKSA